LAPRPDQEDFVLGSINVARRILLTETDFCFAKEKGSVKIDAPKYFLSMLTT
jgi:hypothetical protein